jgi:hypothetical protein
VHAAGAIDDGVLAQQSWSRFETVFRPKLEGAWNLHNLTARQKVDFFILFSSGAALVGSPSQTNYAAANATLDAFAHWRRAQGLPALSIDWGPWGEIGMAANLSQQHRIRLTTQGFQALTPEDGLRALEAAIATGSAQVAVLPADWGVISRGLDPIELPSLIRSLVNTRGSEAADTGADGPDIVEQLMSTPASLRRGMLLRFVRDQAARVLGLSSPDAVPAGRPLSELGLDSLMAVEIRNVLGRMLDLQPPTTLLFDYPNPDVLTDYLLARLPSEIADGRSGEFVLSPEANESGYEPDVATLSEDEAELLLLAELGDG